MRRARNSYFVRKYTLRVTPPANFIAGVGFRLNVNISVLRLAGLATYRTYYIPRRVRITIFINSILVSFVVLKTTSRIARRSKGLEILRSIVC